MYIPSAFQFSEQEAIAFVRENSFGMLVSEGLHVSHIPMLLKETDEGLKLCGHIANNNPQIADINSGAKAKAIFAGPHAYISPLWYSEPLRNVPTWNFQAVEMSGTLTRIPEEEANASLRAQVEQYETKWSIDDLSEKYVAGNLRAISFFELCINDIIGKNKMSQNKSQTERGLIADALTAQDQNDIAHLIRNQEDKTETET